jgi:gas vesicle protein
MNNKSKLFLAFGAGALVGAAAAMFLSSEKGKEFARKAKDQMGDLSDELKKKAKDLEEEISSLLRKEQPDTDPGTEQS